MRACVPPEGESREASPRRKALEDSQAAEIERGKDFVQAKNGPFDLDLAFAPVTPGSAGAKYWPVEYSGVKDCMFAHGYRWKPHAVRVTPPPTISAWLGCHPAPIIGTVQCP